MNEATRPQNRWRRVIRWGLLISGLLSAMILGRCVYALRDRNPGYILDVNIDGRTAPSPTSPLRTGFSRVKINPDLTNPRRPIWLAGFSQHRAATGIHDDLWALACVIEHHTNRLGLVALDAIGLFHDDVIEARRRLPRDLNLSYTVICTTHNHSTPDLMGLWGPNYLRTGVDPAYREQVIAATAQALREATAALRPARVSFLEIPTPTEGLVADTRKPLVFDPDIRVIHFTDPATAATLGTVVNWSNHPETVWSRNTEITSDFCGYLRDALEHGVRQEGKVFAEGRGGTHLFINSAIGGLISTTPSVTVRDPYLEQDFKVPSHEKARALGRQLASRILPRLAAQTGTNSSDTPLVIRAQTLHLPLANPAFFAAPILGLLDRGHARWMRIRTEVALLQLGEASMACVPGEIYPEIVNGGIERAAGGDFDLEPVEVPPIRQMMPGRVKFLFGMANDEVGYLIPKSEWDRKPPYLYGAKKGVYGEINSVGPDAAATIHAALKTLCQAP